MKAIWLLVPVGIYIWVAYGANHKQKEGMSAYFWLVVLGLGAAGILFSCATTGVFPAPSGD